MVLELVCICKVQHKDWKKGHGAGDRRRRRKVLKCFSEKVRVTF